MSDLIKALAVTAELTNTELSKAAILTMETDLQEFPIEKVLHALVRCRKELSGKLTTAAIIDRIEDGRPKADEAWGIALQAMDESATVVMNDEISEAMGSARDIFLSGDEVGARMAFRSAYDRITRDHKGQPVRWFASIGHDKSRREQPIIDAVKKGLLTHDHAILLLPPTESAQLALAGAVKALQIGRAA